MHSEPDERGSKTIRSRSLVNASPAAHTKHRQRVLAQEPLVGLMLTRDEYESLAGTGAHREPLFPTWIEWNKLQMRAAGLASKQGVMAAPWSIDIRSFHAWCASVGATPCIDELRLYSQTAGARRYR